MSIEFKIRPHSGRDVTLVEVWLGDQFIGALYPGEFEGALELRFISKHILAAVFDKHDPPAVQMIFNLKDST